MPLTSSLWDCISSLVNLTLLILLLFAWVLFISLVLFFLNSERLSEVCFPPSNSRYTPANKWQSKSAPCNFRELRSMENLLHRWSRFVILVFRFFLASNIVSIILFVIGFAPVNLSSLLIKPTSNSALCMISVSFFIKSKKFFKCSLKVECLFKNSLVSPWIFIASSPIFLSVEQ